MRVFPGFALLAALALPAYAQPAADGLSGPVLTDKEKADAAQNALGEMRDVLARVAALVEEARGDRDALRLNCVNERKTQISGLVKVAELSLEELRAAVKDRQTEAVDHEYDKVTISRTKVDGYKTEAEQCIGLLAFYTGDVERVASDDNKDSANADVVSVTPLDPTPVRPPVASPIE